MRGFFSEGVDGSGALVYVDFASRDIVRGSLGTDAPDVEAVRHRGKQMRHNPTRLARTMPAIPHPPLLPFSSASLTADELPSTSPTGGCRGDGGTRGGKFGAGDGGPKGDGASGLGGGRGRGLVVTGASMTTLTTPLPVNKESSLAPIARSATMSEPSSAPRQTIALPKPEDAEAVPASPSAALIGTIFHGLLLLCSR